MVPWDANAVLTGSVEEIKEALYRLHRVGYKPQCVVFDAWKQAGLPLTKNEMITPQDLYAQMQTPDSPDRGRRAAAVRMDGAADRHGGQHTAQRVAQKGEQARQDAADRGRLQQRLPKQPGRRRFRASGFRARQQHGRRRRGVDRGRAACPGGQGCRCRRARRRSARSGWQNGFPRQN